MARTETVVSLPREQVYEALMDASLYPRWVVGARRFVTVDATWPAPGSAFTHESWMGILPVKDRTRMIDAERPTRVHLNAAVRPAMTADVLIELHDEADGSTRIVLEEKPVSGIVSRLWNPVFDRAMHARNIESLRRFKKILEERSAQ